MDKIFDIIPPAKAKEEKEEKLFLEEELKESVKIAERTEPEELLEEEEKPAVFGFRKKPVLLLSFLGFVGIVFFVLYFYFPRILVEVWLKTESLNFDQKVQVQKGIGLYTKISIPESLSSPTQTGIGDEKIKQGFLSGRIIIEQASLSQEFLTTGKANIENKAEGVIKIFNDYSTSPHVLVANTRFISSEGKLFRLVQRVTVPGQVLDKGKLTPGTIDVQVVADSPGQSFNIGPSMFSIPGFAGTSRYTNFYAQSFVSMKGGFVGEAQVVSSQDLENAKKQSEGKALQTIKEAMEKKSLEGILLIQEGTPLNITESKSNAREGEAKEKFSYQVKADKAAILVAKEDLDLAAQSYFLNKIESGRKILAESIIIEPKIESIDSQKGLATLILSISGKSYQDLQEGALKEEIKGKTVQEFQASIENLSQVTRARLKIFPSFFKRLPKEADKIGIKFYFE